MGGGMAGPPPDGHRPAGRGEPAMGGGGFAQLPRQTLLVTFTNHSDSAITFVIRELNSAIGNFAPQPEKMTLDPGASATLAPVSGDAGGILNWLDLSLGLRSAASSQTQTIHLEPTGEKDGPPAFHRPPPPPAGER